MQFDPSILNVENNFKILIVEDNHLSLTYITRILENYYQNLSTATNGREGLEVFKKFQPDVVITDIRMPEMDGLTMLKEIKKINPNIQTIVLSAHDEKNILKESIEIQVNRFITKPINANELLYTLNEIHERLIFQKLIKRQFDLIEELFDSLDVIVAICDKHTILGINKIGLETLGFHELEEMKRQNKSICDFFIFDAGFLPNDKQYILENYWEIPQEQRKAKMLNQKTKQEVIFQVKIMNFLGNRDKFIMILYDITLQEQQKEELKKLSMFDFLTGIYNRHHFHTILEFHIEKHNRYENLVPFIILLMDLDHFKDINDRYGHLVGDEVLKEFCNLVKSHIRKSDFFARWGGEEFIIITTEISKEQGILFAGKILNFVRDAFKNHPKLPPLTISIGLTQFIKGDNMKSILERADEALYLAKSKGRDRVEFK